MTTREMLIEKSKGIDRTLNNADRFHLTREERYRLQKEFDYTMETIKYLNEKGE